jgi:lipopolysaccharide transport system permease protein
MDSEDNNWTLNIRPRRAWYDLRLGELWRYRDLIGQFVRRDFVAQYKQTILGPLWYLIQPLMTTITFTIIFGNIARLSTDGLPQFLFYMAGMTVWNYFAVCFTKTANALLAHSGLLGKVYFPRLAIPVSILISNLVTFAIQLGQFVAFALYFMIAGSSARPTLWLLALPLLLVMMAGFGLGFGIIISALTTRYRDLQNVVGFGVQLLMYATPVIYPLSSIPDRWRWLIVLNPLTPVLETFRYAFLGSGSVDAWQLGYSFVTMVIVLTIGVLMFTRVEDTFMDTI